MTNAFTVAAISALALISIATPSFAQSSDPTDLRIEQLLRQLVTKHAARATDPVLVTRAADIKVTGTVRRVSQFHLPVACDVSLFARSDNHDEEKNAPVTFVGNVGTCTVDIPFRWVNTDRDGTVDVDITVGNESIDFLSTTAATANDISRSSRLSLPKIPLPLQGSTTTLTFDIRM